MVSEGGLEPTTLQGATHFKCVMSTNSNIPIYGVPGWTRTNVPFGGDLQSPAIATMRLTHILVDRVGNDPTSSGFQPLANPSQLSIHIV